MKDREKIGLILIAVLGLILFIPNAQSVSDTIYLEQQQKSDKYPVDANKGDIIDWEFRTYDNPFTIYFRCAEDPKIISHDKTANSGQLEVLINVTLHFTFENIGNTGGGYLEFEIKNLGPPAIDGYNLIIILMIIFLLSLVSIRALKKNKILKCELILVME